MCRFHNGIGSGYLVRNNSYNSGVVNQMNLFNYWKIELYSIKNSRFKGIDGERV